MNNIDKTIFTSYEMVEAAFNNDLRAFDANGRMMKARALKGTTYYFKSHKTGRKYDISAEECRMLNLFYNTWDALNKAQEVDNRLCYYNGNVWWFERAELRRKVFEMIDGYIDAFEAWLDEKNEEKETGEEKTAEEVTAEEESEVSGEEKTEGESGDEETPEEKETATAEKEESEASVVDYKLIEGFEDYMVSSDGKVWSLNYRRTGKMKELKPQTNRYGYLQVGLWSNGRRVDKLVHRLVAQAFIPNPYNRPEVNHIDEVKTNNFVENLEWCDAKYNSNFGSRTERVAKANINHPDKSKPVLCVETGKVYPSVHEAGRQTGVYNGNISACCNGKRKTAGGFHWARFVEGD